MKLPRLPPFFWKLLIILSLLVIWFLLSELEIWSPMLFPSPEGTIYYFINSSDFVLRSVLGTMRVLLIALAISSVITLAVSGIATQSAGFRIVLETLIAMINPIPGVALLPFAMLWFGLGTKPILFVSIVGTLAIYIITITNGFMTVPSNLINIGKIYGLNRIQMMKEIYLPATLPSLIAGIRNAWGLSWRLVIAAELVYGAMGKGTGIGWLISVNRYNFNPNGLAAGILAIVIIGFIVENLIIGSIEKKTVKKWGMKK